MGRGAAAAAWAVLAVVWGSTWLFIKVGVETLPPLTFAGIRFVIALVPLGLFLALRRSPLPRGAGAWRLLAVTGLLSFTASYGLVCFAEKHISSGLTAVLFCTYPLFGQLFAHWILPSEPFRLRKGAGALLALSGVFLLFREQIRLGGEMALWGSGAVLLAAAVSAVTGVWVKRSGGGLDPVSLTFWQMALGTAPLLLLGALFEGNPLAMDFTPRAILALLYLALVGTSLAFVLWYQLLKQMEVTRLQTMPLFNTLVAVLLGWAFMGERYGAEALMGSAVVLWGTALALGRGMGRPERQRP